jgi:hypothetical protein
VIAQKKTTRTSRRSPALRGQRASRRGARRSQWKALLAVYLRDRNAKNLGVSRAP